MVELYQLRSGPFKLQTGINHLNTRLVRFWILSVIKNKAKVIKKDRPQVFEIFFYI